MEQALAHVEIGSQVYLEEGDDPCGAVRDVAPGGRHEITVYVEIRESSSSIRTQFVLRTMAKLSWTEHV